MNPELRRDPSDGRWVVVSPERAGRPGAFDEAVSGGAAECPFCPGREATTPPEVLAVRGSSEADRWRVRVVPNRFPALRIEGAMETHEDGLYETMRGIGAHEVVIETREHEGGGPAQYPVRHLADVLGACRDRAADLLRDTRFRYVLVFRNHDNRARAPHPHSQILALPVIPRRIEAQLAEACRYHAERGRCLQCDILAQEREEERRVVSANETFLAVAPYASRLPFEVHIVPKAHEPFFWTLDRAHLDALAAILRDVLKRYALALRDPAYSYVVHTGPAGLAETGAAHWRIEMAPRLAGPSGIEWSSGCFVNPVPPEKAARALRDVQRFMDIPAGSLLPAPARETPA